MPGSPRGRQPQTLIHISVNNRLLDRIEILLKRHSEWNTTADFVRQAMAEKASAVEDEDRKTPQDLELEKKVVGQAKVK